MFIVHLFYSILFIVVGIFIVLIQLLLLHEIDHYLDKLESISVIEKYLCQGELKQNLCHCGTALASVFYTIHTINVSQTGVCVPARICERITSSALALHCYKAHARVNRKIEI